MLIPVLHEIHCSETTLLINNLAQGAAPHQIAKPIKKLLHDTFAADRVLSRGFESACTPPRSLDLNPCDFYLWGHLKYMVYTERNASVAELKSTIKRHVRCVTTQILTAMVNHAVLVSSMWLHLLVRIVSTSFDNFIE
ncbi:uncharacterized protein TNCV_1079101 [Trichonephila clavipes]|nr:uncharacterized protein TNCV_1079101 [Trichonephila clavipes]